MDADPLAAGLYLSDRAYRIRVASDPSFVGGLLRIAKRERVKVLLPTVQEELVPIARRRAWFERAGVVPVVSGTESLIVASDKRRTYDFFAGEPYCPRLFGPSKTEFPLVVKPARSRGGRGFQVCEDPTELRVALTRCRRLYGRLYGAPLVMEYLRGTEYSVYGASGPDAQPVVTVPVRRIYAVGESKKAEVVHHPAVERVVRTIAAKLGLVGPWNVQVMKSKDRITLIEVNPRFAGTTSLVVAAGVNLPEIAIRLFLGRRVPPSALRFRDHLLMTRYNEEIFLGPRELVRSKA